MACKYFYDNKEYTFDEFASLLENGLADELVAKNVLSSSGVYNKKAPVDNMPGAITINSSNADVNVGKGSNVVTKIVRQSQRMVKAMNKLAPNLSFTIHATEESWNQLREQMLANGTDITGMDGFYNPNTNEIHLNVPMMEKLGRLNTAYHEGYHPLTNALFNARPDLRGAMYDQMVIMSEDQTLPKEFRDQIKECIAFGNSYDVEKYGKESPLNEAIVEFLSRVSNGQIQIDGKNKTMMDHIRIFLNNLAGMFNIGVMMGNKEYTVDNLLDFARAMDFAIKQGVAVEFNPRNVPVFNSQDNLETENGDVITSGYYPQTKAIQASFTPMDINWEYADLPSNIQMAVPSNRENLANTLKKSGGAAVFINSDGTGVGVMEEDKYIDGGISYTFFKDNVDNEIGFAASEDSKISSFYKAVKHAAEVRDRTNPEFKGMPVVVYVTVQSAPSTIGNYHGSEFILDNIKEAIAKRKINVTELKKAFDYAAKASIKSRLVKSKGKETKAIKSYNKFLADLKNIKAGDLVNELEKYLKKESFAFRLDILGNIIPNINVKSKTQVSDFQKKLKELNIDLPSFYNKYLDKNILNSLQGDSDAKRFQDNGFTMTGFYVDPYMTDNEYVSKSKVNKFKHKQFNSAFHGTNPFVLNGKYYVNNFFDEARFYSKKKKSFVPVSVSSAGSMYPRTWNSEDFNEIIERAERLTIMPSLAGEFVDKLNETKESDPKQYWSVDNVSLEDAKQGTVIKTEAGYGFVSQDGDIKGVFKANKESAEKTGGEVLKKAVKAGGIKLDNFDGYLTKIYERNGFRIASRIPFNEEYAPEGWEKEAHGTPDVVAMVYDPYKQLDIEEKRFDDYMEGIDYRDSFVGLAYGNAITNGDMPPRIDARPDDLVSASPIVYDMTEDGNGNYVFYTDKVSENNADVNEDGMLELTTEKKGIQPSMVKVPYESTYPLDTNPLGLKGETNKEILQQAKNLGFAAVVNKDMEGNAVVMSDTVMPAEPIGNTQHLPNKQAIQPSLGWAGSKGVQQVEVGKIGMSQPAPVNPIPGNVRELSNKQQSAFNNFTRMYLSATQGNSQAAKSLQETFKGEESYVVEQISKDAIQLSKQIKEFVNSEAAKANGLKEKTINTIVNRARLGETDPKTGVKYVDMLPQDLAESVVQARQNIVTLQEALVRSGLLPSEIQAVIASTIGSYTKTSYYAFELRKKKGLFSLFTKQKTSPWFESVPKDVRDKARGIFTAMAMNGTLDNGFNLILEDYRKNYEEPYLALLAADPAMQSNATQQAATAMNNKLAEVNKKAGEFADAVMRKIEDVNQSGDVNFTIGGSVVSMKDYIEKNPALPKEIKEYLGEIKDPAINFRLTAMKLTRMLYNHQMGAQFKNLGLQSGDVVPASEPTPAGWIKLGEITKGDSKKIKGGALDEMDAVNKYGPLKGCSVTPAMYDLLFDTPIEGNLYYKFITSNVKKFKTIYSPSTQIKNVYGYLYFGMASGAIPEAIYYSPRIVSGAYNQINTPAGFMGYWNNMFSEAKKRGINTSLELEEINRIGKELSENKELLASLKGSTNPAQTIYQTFTDALNKVENFSKKGMMLGDAIPKTIMFEIFRNTNAVILNNTSYYELDARQKEIADEMAARKVKLTTVTDTRTIKAIDLIQRKMGIFGTFPRFMSESIRNFVNAHLLVANPGMLHEGLTLSDNPTKDAEMKKQMDIKTRASGISGLAGYYGLMSLLRAAMGFGDDDDEKVSVSEIPNGIQELSQIINKPEGTLTQNEALRRLLPEYDKFASLSFKVNKDGTVEYRNESSVDPFNIFPQAYRSFIYADNIASGVGSAALQVAMPVLGWEILFGSALEVINNENSKGVEIHKNFDDFASKRIDDIAYILKKAGPGIATSTMRYADLVESGKREGTATGYLQFITTEGVQGRVSTAEVESKLRSKVKEINDMWIADQRKYSGDFYKTKSVEERDLVNKQRDENAKMFAYELNQLVEAGYALGLDNRQVKQVFKDARVSKKVRNASMRGGSYIDNLNINDIKED
jgi:hypothetical protein